MLSPLRTRLRVRVGVRVRVRVRVRVSVRVTVAAAPVVRREEEPRLALQPKLRGHDLSGLG